MNLYRTGQSCRDCRAIRLLTYNINEATQVTISLKKLLKRGNLDDLASYLERIAQGAYHGSDHALLGQALMAFPPAQANERLQSILARHGATKPVSCADLLATVAAAFDEQAKALRSAASTMLKALPQQPLSATKLGRSVEPLNPNLVIDLLDALERIDPALAMQAVAHLRDHPEVYPIDTILRPAVLCLYAAEDIRSLVSVLALRDLVLAELKVRVAAPLMPPADWRRDNPFTNEDEYARALGAFLEDPDQQTWSLQSTKKVRQYIEQLIEVGGCDLDCETDTDRQPHTLTCTKGNRHFLSLAESRQQDWVDLASLEGVAD